MKGNTLSVIVYTATHALVSAKAASSVFSPLIAEIGEDRYSRLLAASIAAMTPEGRRRAVLNAVADVAEWAADVIRSDGDDVVCQLLRESAGSLRSPLLPPEPPSRAPHLRVVRG